MSPMVTVLVPTIGRLTYLEDTIAAVAAQTFSDYEVIVLDNASPEPTQRRLRRWASEDARVRVSRVDNRCPMFHNFARGIEQANGDYVLFFHDDDLYAHDIIEKAVTAFQRNALSTFFASNYNFVDERGNVTERRRWIRHDGVIAGTTYIRQLLRRCRNLVAMPGIVFRRAPLRQAFDRGLSPHFGDFVILMRLAELGDVYLSTETLVQVRRHQGQASNLELSQAIPMRTALLTKYCDDYLQRWPTQKTFIAPLRASVVRAHRTSLLWGWLIAETDQQALACLDVLGDTAADRLLEHVFSLQTHRVRQLLRNVRGRAFVHDLATRFGM